MKKKLILPFLLLTLCCTSCLYQMPGEDVADVRPQTNNPNYVRQAPDTNMPKLNY